MPKETVLEKLHARQNELMTELEKIKMSVTKINDINEYQHTLELGAKLQEISKCISIVENYM